MIVLDLHTKQNKTKTKQKQRVCHNVALPLKLKNISSDKRRIMETQIFHRAKIWPFKRILYKKPKCFKIFQLYNYNKLSLN